MGWDGVKINKSLTKKEIKAYLDDLYEPLDSEMVYDVWYGAVPYQKNKKSKIEVFGLVVFISIDKKEKILWTKEVSEDMGPCSFDCPERIIKLLTPTKDEFSNSCRETCLYYSKKHSTKKKGKVRLEDMQKVTEYDIDTLASDMDTYKFGNYFQNSKSKKTPIEWLLLDIDDEKKEALLISKYILDCKCFNDSCYKNRNDFELIEEKGKSLWEVSTIREWLNNDFYNKAFSKSEKSKICNTKLKTGRTTTNDNVFILSFDEVKKYFKQKDMKDTNARLLAEGTKYAKKVNNYGKSLFSPKLDLYIDKCSNFWLRSKAKNKLEVNSVKPFGGVEVTGRRQDDRCVGVRPSIWIKY